MIDFPDELLHRAKIVAAQRRTTLRELVVKGLETVTSDLGEEQKDSKRRESFARLLKTMRALNTEPMVPLPRGEIYDR